MKKIRVVSLILSILILILLYKSDFLKPEEIISEDDFVEIVVARENIEKRSIIEKSNLELKLINKDFIDSKAYFNIDDVDGKIAQVDILTGDFITKDKVYSDDISQHNLSNIISKGNRAISIEINLVTGVSSLIKVGDRVDVINTKTTNNNEKNTSILLENVKVLALDNQLSEESSLDYSVVTLEVTPKQALELSSSQGLGEYNQLVLRSVE